MVRRSDHLFAAAQHPAPSAGGRLHPRHCHGQCRCRRPGSDSSLASSGHPRRPVGTLVSLSTSGWWGPLRYHPPPPHAPPLPSPPSSPSSRTGASRRGRQAGAPAGREAGRLCGRDGSRQACHLPPHPQRASPRRVNSWCSSCWTSTHVAPPPDGPPRAAAAVLWGGTAAAAGSHLAAGAPPPPRRRRRAATLPARGRSWVGRNDGGGGRALYGGRGFFLQYCRDFLERRLR